MILYLLVILLLLYILSSTRNGEGFENKTFIDNRMYDTFYSKLYDHIWNMIPFYKVQIELMQPYFNTTNNFLCFDCKTGHMPQLLSNNMKVVGLDDSKEMIDIAMKNYPKIPFIKGDCNPSIFKKNLFTHIYCPLFSINTKDLELFFECVDKWLVPKGILFIITYDKSLNISEFVVPNSKVNYDIVMNDSANNTITEKISFKNKKRTNIIHLKDSHFEYYALINKIKIPNYSCYLNVYQKQ